MAMLSEVVDAVIGVDTHRDTNQLEIAHPSGAVIITGSFSNDSAGHGEALAWTLRHAPGPRLVLAIEGTRSYGVGLARAATATAIAVIEAEQPRRKTRRGKLTATTLPKLARRREPRQGSREHTVRHAEIRRLALALREAAQTLKANRAQLAAIVNDLAPGLTDRYGIGPVSGAQAIVSFSHPGRCRNDAAFAALAGTSPIQASSGRTVRHRLNRGGDRALNKAIHVIANTRIRSDPTTQTYVTRRTTEGKTPREIRRCSKRYIARQLYRTLTTAMTPPTPTPASANHPHDRSNQPKRPWHTVSHRSVTALPAGFPHNAG